MLTTLNKYDILLDDERRTDFLSKSNMPQSRVEKPNRFSLIARNAAFLLEERMTYKCTACKVILSNQNWTKHSRLKRYYLCRACLRIKNKTYNVKNKTKIMQNKKRYYHENKTKIDAYNKKRYMDNLKSWEGFIPKQTKCQICSVEICFNSNDRKKAICFDHKKQNVINQQYGPTFWLGQHKRTKETEAIWKKADFGMLCNKCNSFLPTDKRKEYIKKVVKYVYETEKGKGL